MEEYLAGTQGSLEFTKRSGFKRGPIMEGNPLHVLLHFATHFWREFTYRQLPCNLSSKICFACLFCLFTFILSRVAFPPCHIYLGGDVFFDFLILNRVQHEVQNGTYFTNLIHSKPNLTLPSVRTIPLTFIILLIVLSLR